MEYFFLGSYSLEGVGIFSQNGEQINQIGQSESILNPSYLYRNGAMLYAVLESRTYRGENGGAVASFRIANNRLVLTGIQNTFGKDPCHLITDPENRWLFCANYSEGSVSVFPLDETGTIGPVCCHHCHKGMGPHPTRQEQAHVHYLAFTPDQKYLCAVDLGTDRIIGYQIVMTDGVFSLEERFCSIVSPQTGPRHLVFSPDGAFAYLIGELANTITVLRYCGEEGLKPVETISIEFESSALECTGAAVKITEKGDYLYASIRGCNQIAVFSVCRENGMIHQIQTISSFGITPRDISLSPDGKWLLCANQDSNEISLFRRNMDTGELSYQKKISAEKPVCILFY